jgi:hypothetical protein
MHTSTTKAGTPSVDHSKLEPLLLVIMMGVMIHDVGIRELKVVKIHKVVVEEGPCRQAAGSLLAAIR